MAPNTVYDPVRKCDVTWQPLVEVAEGRRIVSGPGNLLSPRYAPYGTCGDLRDPGYESHRKNIVFPIVRQYGVPDTVIDNPEVEEWDPALKLIESIRFARDQVLSVAVTNQTPGEASIAELGLAVVSGILRGQRVLLYIQNDEQTPKQTRTARMLAQLALETTAAQHPVFGLYSSLDQLAHAAGAAMKDVLAQNESGVNVRTEYEMPKRTEALIPAIYLSGTSGKTRPQWLDRVSIRIRGLTSRNVPVKDSYALDWDADPEASANAEIVDKTQNAVQLIAVTGETESLGALAEIGPRLLMALMSGQSLVLYIEPHPSSPKSPTNRARTLVKEHLARLLADFPDLPFIVADSLDELAIHGVSHFLRHSKRI